MSKNMVQTDRPQMTSQYGAYALQLDWHAYMHLYPCSRPRVPVPTCTHARTRMHACTHRPINNTYCFSMAKIIREPSSLLRYTYIARLVIFSSCVFENILSLPIFRHTFVRSFHTLRACYVYDSSYNS